MSVVAIVVFAFIVYPIVAGSIFSRMGPFGGPCLGHTPEGRDCHRDARTWDYRGFAAQWNCANCLDAHFKKREAIIRCWFWPIAWIPLIPMWAFNLGSKLRAAPAQQQESTPPAPRPWSTQRFLEERRKGIE